MEIQYYNTCMQAKSSTSSLRINAVDLLRGFIMILMAFCHERDYIGPKDYTNVYWNAGVTWAGKLNIDIMQQFLTIIVPGGFSMLMGIGIVYFYHSRLKSGWSLKKIRRYLVIRGLVLIALQLTIMQAFEIIAENTVYFYMGVLFALGCCMMVASYIEYLSRYIKNPFILPALVIVIIAIPQQLYINYLQNQHIVPNIWQQIILLSGVFHYGIKIDINFTPLPWIPGVMSGMLIGHLMLKYKNDAMALIGKIAAMLLTTWGLFVVLDFAIGVKIGDYRAVDSLSKITFLSYLCISKYPPSINFYLFACGINLALMYLLSRCNQSLKFAAVLSPVETIGQCALFFYVMHFFVYYGLSLLTPTKDFLQYEVLGAWALGILILYPLCKGYARFKATQPPESLWRLF